MTSSNICLTIGQGAALGERRTRNWGKRNPRRAASDGVSADCAGGAAPCSQVCLYHGLQRVGRGVGLSTYFIMPATSLLAFEPLAFLSSQS
jgi:hypothetical protein